MKHNVKKLLILALTFFVLTPAVTAEAYSVELVGIEDSGHDHTSVYDTIDDYLNSMGYANADINKSTNITSSTLLSRLSRREIIVTRSHGGRFLDSAGNTTGNYLVLNGGNMYNSDIEAFSSNKLADTVLVVYVGCYTASGGVSSSSARNLVVASTEKGATTAVGFEDSIACAGANTWTDYFFWYLSLGKNIDRAANDAVSATRAIHRELEDQGNLGISSMRYRGEWNYTFTN